MDTHPLTDMPLAGAIADLGDGPRDLLPEHGRKQLDHPPPPHSEEAPGQTGGGDVYDHILVLDLWDIDRLKTHDRFAGMRARCAHRARHVRDLSRRDVRTLSSRGTSGKHQEDALVPEIGKTYSVIVEDETDNQWTGPLGIARIGDVDIPIKTAKKGQTFHVRITGVALNQWTNRKHATFEEVEPEASVGEIYNIVISEEFENQWTGPLGIANIGDVRVPVKKAKTGDRFTIQITEIGTNQYTKQKEAKFTEITSDRAVPKEQGVDFEVAGTTGQWVSVAPADAISEGTVKGAKLDDTKIAIVNVGGKIYAVGGVCPHRDAPMAIGRLVGDELECPWHRFRFSVRTGQPTVPVDHPPLPCFAVRVENGQVQVSVPDPANTPQRPVV